MGSPEARHALSGARPRRGEVALDPDGFIVPRAEASLPAHGLLGRLLEEVLASGRLERSVRLKETSAGAELLSLPPERAAAVLRAALARCLRLSAIASSIRERQIEEEGSFRGFGAGPEARVWDLRRVTADVVGALLRRKLPLVAGDVHALGLWCVGFERDPHHYLSHVLFPIGSIVRAYVRLAAVEAIPARTRAVFCTVNALLERQQDSDARKHAAPLARALAGGSDAGHRIIDTVPPPAPVGAPGVLVALKQHLGILPSDEVSEQVLEGDHFAVRDDSPLRAEHGQVASTLEELQDMDRERSDELHAIGWRDMPRRGEAEARYRERIVHIASDLARRCTGREPELGLALLEREIAHSLPGAKRSDGDWARRQLLVELSRALDPMPVPRSRDLRFDRALAAVDPGVRRRAGADGMNVLIGDLEALAAERSLDGGERHVVHRLRTDLFKDPPMCQLPLQAQRLSSLLDGEATYVLQPGERWTDQLHADLARMDGSERETWLELLPLAFQANAARPTAKFRKSARPLIEAVGEERFRERVARWLGAVPKGRTFPAAEDGSWWVRNTPQTVHDGNATVLRGLVWMLAFVPGSETPRNVADLLSTAVRKVPGVGPRSVKVANACIWTLGELAASDGEALRMSALGQLARLKARVRFKTTLKAIAKALDKAASRAGVPREELEEIGVPSFGFFDGACEERFGAACVRLSVEGNKVVTRWTNAKGNAIKSPPAAVRRDFAEELKDVKLAAKDAEGILMAARDRLDNLFVGRRAWSHADWRARYLDHGLVGTVARKLVWLVDGCPVLPVGDVLQDVAGDRLACSEDSRVSLWHPVDCTEHEVVAWRARIEALEITQPFRQAHREIYPLTDAERETDVYSNRFASHILKQHQFHALCGARGWNNRLRLAVDDSYTPAFKELPAYGLRAEFWVESANDSDDVQINDAGVHLYLATDQVRFYRIDAAENHAHAAGGSYESSADGPGAENVNDPLPLADIDPLALSEVMRDVDLFVGVASVGNDPNWVDGGPEGRYRDYWHSYSFGDLSATAETRRVILQRLVPRLSIADRCAFDDRFLVVRGDLRTYRIHLGSSNVLMAPNDQYLCIVPSRGAPAGDPEVLLPFEGDQRLSVILSKAFLLAEDAKIGDRSILNQIQA
ncbi:MAG: DUF4132 domain-containing protein [Planctomycetota bacterium]